MKARMHVTLLFISLIALTALSVWGGSILAPIISSALAAFYILKNFKKSNARIQRRQNFFKNSRLSAHRFIIDRVIEIRRPLQGLIGVHDLYLSTNSNNERSDYLEIAEYTSRFLLRQLERIQFHSELELGRIPSNLNVFSIQKCLNDVIQISTDQMTENIVVSQDIHFSTAQYLYGNEVCVKKILREVLQNSIKHSGGHEVIIKVSADDKFQDRLLFAIHDDGNGMSQSELRSVALMDHSSSITKETKCGLGFALIKKIIKICGGELRFISEKGAGTQFSFTLPVEQIRAATENEIYSSKLFSNHSVENSNVILGDFTKKQNRVKEGGYYINFNSLFNSLNENLAQCRQILARTRDDIIKANQKLAIALKINDQKVAVEILEFLFSELTMVHCVHGLETITELQNKITNNASPEQLLAYYENVNEIIHNIKDEIDHLLQSDGHKIAV